MYATILRADRTNRNYTVFGVVGTDANAYDVIDTIIQNKEEPEIVYTISAGLWFYVIGIHGGGYMEQPELSGALKVFSQSLGDTENILVTKSSQDRYRDACSKYEMGL